MFGLDFTGLEAEHKQADTIARDLSSLPAVFIHLLHMLHNFKHGRMPFTLRGLPIGLLCLDAFGRVIQSNKGENSDFGCL